MIPYPHFDPVLVSIGPLKIRWYGMMYILAFAVGALILRLRRRETGMNLSGEALSDLIFYMFLGVLLGGRLGYILFYNPVGFALQPAKIFMLWDGGMSFHGGFVGIILAGLLFAWRKRYDFYRLADMVMPAVPLGLGLGRLGNFINGELWGRPAPGLPWGMVFPLDPTQEVRHPSQLYELTLEGIIPFVVLWLLRNKPMPKGTLFWLFITMYGVARIISEQFREPDEHLKHILGGLPHMTAGMLLSLPLLFIGVAMTLRGYRRWGQTRAKRVAES